MKIEFIDFKQNFRIQRISCGNDALVRNAAGQYRLNENLMLFPSQGGVKILFSFLTGKAFKISSADYRKYIERFNEQPSFPYILLELGIVVGRGDTLDKAFFDPPPKMFQNLALNMVPTCNLRCRYCYASSGRRTETAIMPLSLALNIVGEGEPTLVFDSLRHVIAYAKRKVKRVKVNPLSTNGVVTSRIATWLARNIDELQVSCDGPGFIQDKYRPLASGGKSSPAVERTIRQFVRMGKNFRVRATITDDTFGNEKKVINYFFQLGVQRLMFGVLENVGATAGMIKVKQFRQRKVFRKRNHLQELLVLAELQDEVGMRDYDPYLSRIGTTVTCGIYTKSFFVLDPYGNVSACERHTGPYDFKAYPFLKEFIIGRYNPEKKDFDIDFQKLEWFQETIRAILKANACASCSQAPACGAVCLYQIAHRHGSFFPVRRHCDSVDKQFPASMFKYITDKYLVRKIPCLELQHGVLSYRLTYHSFSLSVQRVGGSMRENPYVYVTASDDLIALAKDILAYKNRRVELTLFLLMFDFNSETASRQDGERVRRFLSVLKKNHVYFKISRPLPRSLWGQEYLTVCTEYGLPAHFKECVVGCIPDLFNIIRPQALLYVD
ncbi:MAG: Radical SAM [Parcubacteria group bacterium GW2011_GWA1_45_7]|nr:MAG: Radical SAM [Parcubacteria group bacterium GW2011_GWA1_45_7]